MRQQQHNRLRNIERSSVTVSSYPCGSAAAFVIPTIVVLCWHVIHSRSLFLTFSSAAREDVSVEKTVTSRQIRYSITLFFSTLLSLCFKYSYRIALTVFPPSKNVFQKITIYISNLKSVSCIVSE